MQEVVVWMLFALSVHGVDKGHQPQLAYGGMFQTMEECFKAREVAINNIGRPIMNYQVVCIPKKLEGEAL
jgi:hypothetical protein